MAPKKCGGCDAGIFGRQDRICCQSCELNFHLHCAKVAQNELEFYIVDGVSIYKCDPCQKKTKKKNDGTPVSSVGKCTALINSQIVKNKRNENKNRSDVYENDLDVDNDSGDKTPSKTFSSSTNNSPSDKKLNSMMDIIKKFDSKFDNLLDIISHMRNEINCLKGENIRLRNEIMKMNVFPIIQESVPKMTPSEHPSDDVEPSGTEDWVSVTSKKRKKKAGREGDGFQKNDKGKKRTVHESSQISHAPILSSEKKLSTKQSRDDRIMGVRTSKKVLVKERRRALFVSRFLPDTMCTDIKEFLQENSTFETLECIKLNSKFPDKYSSFHVSVDEREYNQLKKADNWPKGALIVPFYGKIRSVDKTSTVESLKEQQNNGLLAEEGRQSISDVSNN